VKPASFVVHKIQFRLKDSRKTCYNDIKNGTYVIKSYGRGQMEQHELLEVRSRSRNVIRNWVTLYEAWRSLTLKDNSKRR